MKIVVTGGLGFIGSHFIERCLNEDVSILNIDKVTYAANRNLLFNRFNNYKEYLVDINHGNVFSPLGLSQKSLEDIIGSFSPEYVIHFAAESHVDNSIKSADAFVKTNIYGTFNLLEICKNIKSLKKFLHVSTDEVFGTLNLSEPAFTKNSPYKPNSPYAASKAASDLLVRSYQITHKFPAIITNCSNNFGPRQFPEKLIPLAIQKLKAGEQVPIYGNGQNIRDWIFVKDHAKILFNILLSGEIGEQYLIGGDNEITNLQLIRIIKEMFEECSGKKIREDYIKFVEDRKGHDTRYAIDNSHLKKSFPNFKLSNFEESLIQTIESYI